MSVRVVDKSASFVKRNSDMMDIALDRMAGDVEQIAETKIPLLSGKLQGEVKKKRISSMHHQVRVDSDYASYQERGRRKDGSRTVRNYTTPGTGKDFLKNAGKSVSSKSVKYIRQAASRVKV